MRWGRGKAVAGLLAVTLVAVACTPDSLPTSSEVDSVAQSDSTSTVNSETSAADDGRIARASTTTTSSTPTTDASTTTRPPDANPASVECRAHDDFVPWESERSVDVPVVAELDDGTRVRAAVYPHPDYDARLWSQWGQGIVLEDGRVLSAIGDHEGVDGNSFFYVYDPGTNTLTQIGDALSLVDHTPGAWGFGKIHAQMLHGPCDDVIVSTYWGTRSGLQFSGGYRGDILIRIDPRAESLSVLGGVILDGHGIASMAATSDGSMLFAEAADPMDQSVGAFVALDGFTGEQLFVERASEVDGLRALAVLDDDRVLLTWSGDSAAIYDPVEEQLRPTGAQLPGDRLRAAEHAGGRLVAVTQSPPVFFEVDETGAIDPIGEARGYTTSMTSPDGRHYWYIPDAHGGAWESGTPLIEFDADTGDDRVLISLNPTVGAELGFRLGGTYNITSSADGKKIFIGFNGAPEAQNESFGEVVFVVVELP